MLYLLLCILSSTAISLLFKFSERFGVKVFHLVVLNYFIAAALGFSINGVQIDLLELHQQPWIGMALLIGILFILMFLFIGEATRQVGVAVTIVASKMSVVVPMIFSILYYSEAFGTVKFLGILVAVLAVVLMVLKGSKVDFDPKHVYFPILLFLGAGITDSCVKFAQEEFLDQASSSIFSGVLFAISAFAGVVASIAKRERIADFFAPKTLLFGIALGFVNFGSLYFMILALDTKVFESSIIFGLNNLGVVLLSVVGAMLMFTEKLTWLNWIGVAASLIAIAILGNV